MNETDVKKEARWRAEDDAATLARYNEIIMDKKRVSAATKVAKEKAKKLMSEANAMNKVANKKTGGK